VKSSNLLRTADFTTWVQSPTSYTLLRAVFYSKFLPRGINKTGFYELFNINEIWILGAQMSELRNQYTNIWSNDNSVLNLIIEIVTKIDNRMIQMEKNMGKRLDDMKADFIAVSA
jgi:hypothetical protein